MQISNALSSRTEDFSRGPGERIHLFQTGPAPAPRYHLGHALSGILFDVLVRFLRDQYGGAGVHHALGLHDLGGEDHLGELSEGSPAWREAVEGWCGDLQSWRRELNLLDPDSCPRSSQHVESALELVEILLERDFAYRIEGQGVFFHLPALGGEGPTFHPEERPREAVAPGREGLRHPRDFCLWEYRPHPDAWESPWGAGRPTAPVGAVVMAADSLGMPLDLCGGGEDLRLELHEPMLALVEAAGVQTFSRFWLQHGLLRTRGRPMGADGEILEIGPALARHGAGGVRHFCLGHLYRESLEFQEEGLEASARAYQRIVEARERVLEIALRPQSPVGMNAQVAALEADIHHARETFTQALEDDLHTPRALAAVHQLVRALNKGADWVGEDNPSPQLQAVLRAAVFVLDTLARTLGFVRADGEYLPLPTEQEVGTHEDRFVDLLVELRVEARDRQDYATADKIRACLEEAAIELQDSSQGTRWSRR